MRFKCYETCIKDFKIGVSFSKLVCSWNLCNVIFSYQVDLYVSRDLDSRLSDREHAAVQEWIKSNKSIHVMRDHIMHDFAMVGCCWGTKLNGKNIRLQWKSAWNDGQNDAIMYAYPDRWGPDQIFLER